MRYLSVVLSAIVVALALVSGARADANEVMVSSGDKTSAFSSLTINLPTGTRTQYRIVFNLKKDSTAGPIAVFANGDTTNTWSIAKYGQTMISGNAVSTTKAGCYISLNVNNQDANSLRKDSSGSLLNTRTTRSGSFMALRPTAMEMGGQLVGSPVAASGLQKRVTSVQSESDR